MHHYLFTARIKRVNLSSSQLNVSALFTVKVDNFILGEGSRGRRVAMRLRSEFGEPGRSFRRRVVAAVAAAVMSSAEGHGRRRRRRGKYRLGNMNDGYSILPLLSRVCGLAHFVI